MLSAFSAREKIAVGFGLLQECVFGLCISSALGYELVSLRFVECDASQLFSLATDHEIVLKSELWTEVSIAAKITN